MRINKYIAAASLLSRRAADAAIAAGRVTINGQTAAAGSRVQTGDDIRLNGTKLTLPAAHTTIVLHKPVGYVCSRRGQGSRTVFDLLPPAYHHLQPVGRLDKDSSGLLVLTDDGELALRLTHPRYAKTKRYEVTLDMPLRPLHHQLISDYGVTLPDGPSRFAVTKIEPTGTSTKPAGTNQHSSRYEVVMTEGRNRQIRRTFAALGYRVQTLHRTSFGPYTLGNLPSGAIRKAI